MNKSYLGDSVYAEFDGYHVILTTENGDGPSNRICLDPGVLDCLDRYKNKIFKRAEKDVDLE